MKILKKSKTIALPVKASFWFLVTSILQKSISFITVPIFTHLLTPEEFGMINVYLSWGNILTIFATLTLWGGVFNNGMLKYDENQDSFLSSLQGLSTFVTCILFLVFVLFEGKITEWTGLPMTLIILLFVQILFDPALNLWSAKQRFDFKYKKLVVTTIIISLANPLLGIVLVLNSNNGGVARIVSISVVQILVGSLFYIRNLKIGKTFFKKDIWRYALSFNLPLIPHFFSQTILNQADRIMIDRFLGADKAGIYSVAYSVGMILLFVVSSINSAFTPWVFKKMKDKTFKLIEDTSYSLLNILGALIILLICVAPEIIRIMAPPEYSEAVWAIPPIALSVYFIFLYSLFANIEFYYEKNKFIMVASVLVAIFNIILNWIFIPKYGYISAGYTTLVSYVLYSFSHFIFMQRIFSDKEPSSKIFTSRFLIINSVLMIVLSLMITLTYELTLIRYLFLLTVILFIVKMRKRIMKSIANLK